MIAALDVEMSYLEFASIKRLEGSAAAMDGAPRHRKSHAANPGRTIQASGLTSQTSTTSRLQREQT